MTKKYLPLRISAVFIAAGAYGNFIDRVKLNYVVDIYPFYGSDVGAALHAGYDVKGALIGPGVHASHGMERTHFEGVKNTLELIYHYLTK